MNIKLIIMTAVLMHLAAVLYSGELIAKTQPLTLTFIESKGDFTINYIQGSKDFYVALTIQPPAVKATVELTSNNGYNSKKEAATSGKIVFSELPFGEYTLKVESFDTKSNMLSQFTYTNIGVGTIIAALGDSITEGFWSDGIMHPNLLMKAEDFPAAMVSKDKRNFPAYAPSTAHHKPDINCFKSWMPLMNDILSEKLKRPVFIANEGLGGHTTSAYLNIMRGDTLWQTRMKKLKANYFIIHLGVNDERYNVKPETFEANYNAIVDILIKDYKAVPKNIIIAYPSFDRHPNGDKYYPEYRKAIERMATNKGITIGPDFYAAYAKDTAKYYGGDSVHPNATEGMNLMAELCSAAIEQAVHRDEAN